MESNMESEMKGSGRLVEVIQKLYDAEINCEISTFWDLGVRARIGDSINGYVWDSDQCWFDLDALADELLGAAYRLKLLDEE